MTIPSYSRSDIDSLERRLAEAEENLRLVRERKSEFVQQSDIPLQIIKDERRLEQEIETLKARLAQKEDEVKQTPPVGIHGDMGGQVAAGGENAIHVSDEGGDQITIEVGDKSTAATPPLSRNTPLFKLPLFPMLFLNLVVVSILALILGPSVRTSLPCVSQYISAPSLAVILLLLFHLVWRCLSSVIREVGDAIEVGPVAVPVKVLVSLFDALHPWILSDAALWGLAVVLSLAAMILGISPLSPFPPPSEEMPIVQSLYVQYLETDGMTISFKPGDVVEINAGELVLVQAEILGQHGALCTWSAVNGSLQPAEGCATLYRASLHETRDVLDIRAQSLCQTQSASASLHMIVMLSNQ